MDKNELKVTTLMIAKLRDIKRKFRDGELSESEAFSKCWEIIQEAKESL